MKKHCQDTTLSPQERAEALLADLTLDEKMAQVTGVFPFDTEYRDFEAIRRKIPYGIGEVSTLEMRREETLEGAAQWQRQMQELVMEQSPHHIPAIFHMEGLCGAFIQDTTSFPSGIARGAGFDPELEEKIGEIVSRQEAACGVTRILAPVLDIARDARMGRYGEAYGEDPALASALGAAFTRGIQKNETAGRRTDATAKHFMAFHNSEGGIHGAVSDTTPRLLREVYGKPFQAAIAEGALKGVMPCYCTIDGEPASASRRLLTDILRTEMGFDGVTVSDYGAVDNAHRVLCVGETAGEAGLRCMEAGTDVELSSACGYGPELRQMFAEGKADLAILDQAVLRVLTAKFRMGLFEHPFAGTGEKLRRLISETGGRAVSLRSARESVVLLKNDGILPLRREIGRLAVIGPHAAFARKMFGGYTHLTMMESVFAVANSIAGVSGIVSADPKSIVTIPGTKIQSDETPEFDAILRRQKPDCRSFLEELRLRLPETEILYAYGYPAAGEEESGFEEALDAVRQADAVILTLGGKYGTCSMASMGEGVDGSNINLPPCQDAFIQQAALSGKPLIGVHFDGRPISSDTADACLNAILEAWSPAETGAQAVTDVLLGEYNPAGRLPVTVARNAGQLPVYYNHPNGSSWHQSGSIGFANYVDLPHTPRYFFGYGLSYTEFAYSGLRISPENPGADGAVSVCFTLANTGSREGEEVAQLYLRDEYASMVRPVKELAGFKRVFLRAGESKTVTFIIKPGQTAFLDKDMRWKTEKGRIQVQVGASSEDIRLIGEYTVAEDAYLNARDRAFYADVSVEQGVFC